jgi:hypothetical protein
MFNNHWGYRINAINLNYATIYCPTSHEDRINGFSDVRAILRELKDLEENLKAFGFKGWTLWTQLTNVKMMKILTKTLKSFPYYIDVKNETIWFKKEI